MPGNKYKISYLKIVIKKDIPRIPKSMKVTIKSAIEQRLVTDPIGFGKPLQYSLKGSRRLRVGSYRVLYRVIPENNEVLITSIQHRKAVYLA